ncbi:MAG: hypothetical protein VXY28_07995 [Bacteroidota bacterium]|nr:hypothetical protein [Bacteroidota bacterium]
MEEIDTKKIDLILQELTQKIASLKQNESDIQGVISICYSLQEELIILKYHASENFNQEINDELGTAEKNQTNLIDAIEIEEFEEIIENKAEETKQKKKIDEEKRSVNEILSQSQTTLADQFGEQKILDLTKEIGLNERFLLTQNLFNGDASLFEKTINRLNNCSSKEEALTFFKNDLAKTFDWNLKSTMVKKFIKLIERRYH